MLRPLGDGAFLFNSYSSAMTASIPLVFSLGSQLRSLTELLFLTIISISLYQFLSITFFVYNTLCMCLITPIFANCRNFRFWVLVEKSND